MKRNECLPRMRGAVVLIAALPLGSCGHLNHDSTLGVDEELEAFGKAPAVMGRSGPGTADTASVQGLGRENWVERRYVVSSDGTGHLPIYTSGTQPRYADAQARQRGQFPTEESVLETWTYRARLDIMAEAVASPFWAGFDILSAPCRGVRLYPWESVYSPGGPRERAPQADRGTGR